MKTIYFEEKSAEPTVNRIFVKAILDIEKLPVKRTIVHIGPGLGTLHFSNPCSHCMASDFDSKNKVEITKEDFDTAFYKAMAMISEQNKE